QDSPRPLLRNLNDSVRGRRKGSMSPEGAIVLGMGDQQNCCPSIIPQALSGRNKGPHPSQAVLIGTIQVGGQGVKNNQGWSAGQFVHASAKGPIGFLLVEWHHPTNKLNVVEGLLPIVDFPSL